MKTTTIDFTKAIASGKLTFEQACALQGATMTEAIQEGILTFEEACELQGMTVEVSSPAKIQAPKAEPAKKAKATKQTKAEEPKAEEEPKAPVYSKQGYIIQYGDDIAAKGKEKGKLTKAYNSLWEQDFAVEKKRVGEWAYLYRAAVGKDESGKNVYADGRTWKEFEAAKLDEGWIYWHGMWACPDLFKDYQDSIRK